MEKIINEYVFIFASLSNPNFTFCNVIFLFSTYIFSTFFGIVLFSF
jgi:hypothetical protein